MLLFACSVAESQKNRTGDTDFLCELDSLIINDITDFDTAMWRNTSYLNKGISYSPNGDYAYLLCEKKLYTVNLKTKKIQQTNTFNLNDSLIGAQITVSDKHVGLFFYYSKKRSKKLPIEHTENQNTICFDFLLLIQDDLSLIEKNEGFYTEIDNIFAGGFEFTPYSFKKLGDKKYNFFTRSHSAPESHNLKVISLDFNQKGLLDFIMAPVAYCYSINDYQRYSGYFLKHTPKDYSLIGLRSDNSSYYVIDSSLHIEAFKGTQWIADDKIYLLRQSDKRYYYDLFFINLQDSLDEKAALQKICSLSSSCKWLRYLIFHKQYLFWHDESYKRVYYVKYRN